MTLATISHAFEFPTCPPSLHDMLCYYVWLQLIVLAFAYRTDFAEIVKTARWEYSTKPIFGWGNVSSKQKATAGWLAAFPVFEPHWQICMAGGLSTGIGYYLI